MPVDEPQTQDETELWVNKPQAPDEAPWLSLDQAVYRALDIAVFRPAWERCRRSPAYRDATSIRDKLAQGDLGILRPAVEQQFAESAHQAVAELQKDTRAIVEAVRRAVRQAEAALLAELGV